MAVACTGCGQEYDRDPALEVACPVCDAPPGSKCVSRAPSGHVKSGSFQGLPPWGHDERDWKALQEVDGYDRCTAARQRPAAPPVERTEQATLF